jgi:alkanesulfonate monooxygenase SsuD/methylene tetrahydromethanopterin reductase-like flavin-dependent oxidoreductase (luciferase family)
MSTTLVRFGVHAGPQMCTMPELRAVWSAAEANGFDWVSVWDHFYPAPSPLDGDCFEAVACHAALAALTTHVRVGSLVYSAGYRHPAVLANAGVTIDHLSGGRLEMGIGAGWHQWEYDAYGIPFEAPSVRLRRMAEAVEIVRLLWTQDTTTYKGEFFTLTEARCNPKPLQTPPRIWVGASGEQLALKLAGRVGDGWNIPFVTPGDFARKRDVVLSSAPHPERLEVGVNLSYIDAAPGQIAEALKVRFGPAGEFMRDAVLAGDPDMVGARVQEYVDAGAGWVVLALRAPFELQALERFAGEVMPRFR